MKLLLVIALVLYIFTASAQGGIRGRLIDSGLHYGLSLATVSVYEIKDSTLITFRLTTTEGDFLFAKLPSNVPLKMIVYSSGHLLYRKEFQMPSNTVNDFGNINIASSPKDFNEKIELAEVPPMIVSKDSVIYYAPSFSNLPNASLVSFLKQHSLVIDKEGNFIFMGSIIKTIKMVRTGYEVFDL